MKKRLVSLVLISALFLNFAAPVFADDTTPVPYDDKEFPQTLKDLRRFEIITLGALPFVTLDTTLVYSTIRYAKHDFSALRMNRKPSLQLRLESAWELVLQIL